MAVDPTQQHLTRSGGGAPSPRGDLTAFQRDQAAMEMAKKAAAEADEAEMSRRQDYTVQQEVVNYTDEPLTDNEWQVNSGRIIGEAEPQPVTGPLPATGVIDVSTPELADAVRAQGAVGQRLGAVPDLPRPTVQGPRIVTIVGDDLMGFVYGDLRFDLLSGRQYKVPGAVADHLIRKRAAV